MVATRLCLEVAFFRLNLSLVDAPPLLVPVDAELAETFAGRLPAAVKKLSEDSQQEQQRQQRQQKQQQQQQQQ